MQDEYDILIVGGGMVGASLACALAPANARIAVIERYPLQSAQQPSYDDRTLALSYSTRQIFVGMGLWPELSDSAEPIVEIHVSDRGRFGATRLRARDQATPALGYVAESRAVGNVLYRSLQGGPEFICPAQTLGLVRQADHVEVQIEQEGQPRTLRARLVVAADGARSVIREALGIGVQRWTYGQTAVITNVTPGRPHERVAYERFTDSGPLALLPMRPLQEAGHSVPRCGVVLTLQDGMAEEALGWDDEHFLAFLQERFGNRLGPFQRVGRRASYPLQLLRARESIRDRVALIGNAAHTLHPVAGQGFNLGLRDVAVLAEILLRTLRAGGDPGQREVLEEYARWRQRDQRNVILFTDSLVRIFTNPLLPVRLARSLGLLGLDLCPSAKRFLARRTMGLGGHLPRLARGLPLT